MKSAVVKRSIVIAGHKSSVSLEDAFWKALREIAHSRNMTLSHLVGSIDAKREHANLSSAIRLFILDSYRKRVDRETTARDASQEPMAMPLPRSA
jgi:predicted DNA-binding ribbon-helix-helix protein